jgi:hypothetical protein
MPQEVILDRFVRTELRKQAGCSGYSGKLDIERVEPASLRSFLYSVQEAMNEALRSEGINASGGVEHPPFHFDYIDVADGTANAHFRLKSMQSICAQNWRGMLVAYRRQ